MSRDEENKLQILGIVVKRKFCSRIMWQERILFFGYDDITSCLIRACTGVVESARWWPGSSSEKRDRNKVREGIEVAAKGAAERTRMRRICRIGPIYGATCHRGGFRRCEISPAMVPCERSLWKRERERDSVTPPIHSAGNPARKKHKKLMRRIKRSTSRKNSRQKILHRWRGITIRTRWISVLSLFTFRFSSQSFGLVSKSNISLHNYLENRFKLTNFGKLFIRVISPKMHIFQIIHKFGLCWPKFNLKFNLIIRHVFIIEN